MVYVGVQPIEDEALALLEASFSLTEKHRLVFKYPEMDEACARQLLNMINALPKDKLAVKPMRFVCERLRRGLRRLDKLHNEQHQQTQPMQRSWDLWALDAGAAVHLGQQLAPTSLDALKAGPAYIGGRVVAVPHGVVFSIYVQPGAEQAAEQRELQS